MGTWIYELERHVGKLMAQVKTPGLSLAIADQGETVYAEGFGFRNAELGLPARAGTIYGIGSITKSFTCVAVMQLQERGRLRVTDPVVEYLPEFRLPDPDHAARVTVEHLMTNTAGLPPLPSLFGTLKRSVEQDPNAQRLPLAAGLAQLPYIDTYEQLMDFIAGQPFQPLRPPGTLFSYSNDGFALLGAIVERVSGEPYPEYVRRHILEPAGMERSTFDPAWVEQLPEATMLYQADPKTEEVTPAPGWWQAPAMLAAGFLRSTVEDMLRYLEIFRTGGRVGREWILSPESVQAMTTPRIPCGPNMWYGYGLMITPYRGMTLVEHGGNLKGVSAWVTCIPERGVTGVVLSNLNITPVARMLLGAVNAYLGLPTDARRFELRDHPCPPEQLAAYAGEYPSGEGATLVVRVEEGGLVLELMGKKLPARCVGEHLFAFEYYGDSATVRFLPDDTGKIWAVFSGFRVIRKAA